MPTIQVRIDDKTKSASTALFNQLGITMSDAINLFLRQTIMQGGIPFTLTVPGKPETDTEAFVNEAFLDAIRRYKAVNNKIDFDIAKAEPFLRAIEPFDSGGNMRITLQENAVKARLKYNGREYVFDYNFDESNSVFILTRKDGKLYIKDSSLEKISETLEIF